MAVERETPLARAEDAAQAEGKSTFLVGQPLCCEAAALAGDGPAPCGGRGWSSVASRSRRRPSASLENSGAGLRNSRVSCLRNSDSESRKLRSQPAATAVSLINSVGRQPGGGPTFKRDRRPVVERDK
jgi:hypothetical protein